MAGVRRTTHGFRGRSLVRDVLDPDERGLRAVEVAPAPDLPDDVAVPDDAPEVVVRGQEHEVPAAVAVAARRGRTRASSRTRDGRRRRSGRRRVAACGRSTLARGPIGRGRRRACRSTPASAGSRGGSAGRTARRGRGTPARAGRCRAACPRTTSRACRRRRRRGSCRPATSASGGRPRRARSRAGVGRRRTARIRCVRQAPRDGRSRGRSANGRPARTAAAVPCRRWIVFTGVTGMPFILGVARRRVELRSRLEDLNGQASRAVRDDESCPLPGPVALPLGTQLRPRGRGVYRCARVRPARSSVAPSAAVAETRSAAVTTSERTLSHHGVAARRSSIPRRLRWARAPVQGLRPVRAHGRSAARDRGDRRVGRRRQPLPDDPRRDRHRQDGDDGVDDRAPPAPRARHRAQQDARRAALQRVPRVLPGQRGRVLRLVLRLLPARGVHPAGRPLHREGLVSERRHRAASALGDVVAPHPPRRRRHRLRLVHLRSRLARGVARARAHARGGGDARPRRGAAQAHREPVRAQRHRARARPLPGEGRPRRDPAGEHRDGLPRLVLRRRGRADHALRLAHGRGLLAPRQPRHLAGDRVRDVEPDDRARGRRSARGARAAGREVRGRGADARGAPDPPAHRVRPRDDEGARLLQRDRELLARARGSPGRLAPVHAHRLLPRRLRLLRRRVAPDGAAARRDVRGRPLAQADAHRLRLPAPVGARQPAAPLRRVPREGEAARLRLRDAGPVRALALEGDRRAAHPPDGRRRPRDGAAPDAQPDRRPPERDPPSRGGGRARPRHDADEEDVRGPHRLPARGGRPRALPALRDRHARPDRDHPRAPPRRLRRPRRRQPPARGPRPAGGVARRRARRRQGGLPARQDGAHPDDRPRRPQHGGQGHPVRGQAHRGDRRRDGGDVTPPRDPGRLQRGARDHARRRS